MSWQGICQTSGVENPADTQLKFSFCRKTAIKTQQRYFFLFFSGSVISGFLFNSGVVCHHPHRSQLDLRLLGTRTDIPKNYRMSERMIIFPKSFPYDFNMLWTFFGSIIFSNKSVCFFRLLCFIKNKNKCEIFFFSKNSKEKEFEKFFKFNNSKHLQ